MSKIDGSASPLAAIFGICGSVLTDDEQAFFRKVNPLGFILFARNCDNPGQLRALTDSLRECMGRDIPILIDQEGGRVQRLKPPHWRQYPAAAAKGHIESLSAVAADLLEVGINVNCTPVLDVTFPQTHAAIGDRSFSDDPDVVAAQGIKACETYLASGIMPVIKHLPGLGRADLDTHKDLPVVSASQADMESTDFLPFRRVCAAAPDVWGMIGHAVYSEIDPHNPASCSEILIKEIVRNSISFNGLLLSDDLGMDALERIGDLGQRAAAALAAGCDIALHCSGDMAEMQSVANSIEKMTDEAIMRYNRSVSRICFDVTGHRSRNAAAGRV